MVVAVSGVEAAVLDPVPDPVPKWCSLSTGWGGRSSSSRSNSKVVLTAYGVGGAVPVPNPVPVLDPVLDLVNY